MTSIAELFRRLSHLYRSRDFDRELEAEMEFHREMAAKQGKAFGNVLRIREESRDAWGWSWLESVLQDISYACRSLRKSPGFTVAAVLTLALGIGVNVAAFGFFNLFALRSLPVHDPSSIIRFQRRSPLNYSTHLSYPAFDFYRRHTGTLSAMLALTEGKLSVDNSGKPARAQFVSANYFSELGCKPLLGRLFEAGSQNEPGLVISYSYWRSRFGADPGIVGKTLRCNRRQTIVIGVAPEQFSGLTSGSVEMWVPIEQYPSYFDGSKLLQDFSTESVMMWGRLRAGFHLKSAEDEMRTLTAQLRQAHPDAAWENEWLASEPGASILSGQGQQSKGTGDGADNRAKIYATSALAGALVFLILAVACANLGGLSLARGVSRQREIAIRLSIGAGIGRLIRQLFTESLVLAALGSVAGALLGNLALRAAMTASEAPTWLDSTPDWRVLAFTVGLGGVASLLFGLAPALQIAKQRQRATTARQILIGAQVTASCVLLIVAGLLVRALDRAISQDPGFQFQQVLSIDPHLATHGYSAPSAQRYMTALQTRLRGIPSVGSVALSTTPPLGRKTVIESSERNGLNILVHLNRVSPEFFQTMAIRILRGRQLSQGDSTAIVISESLARRRFPNEDPIGKPLRISGDRTVIGVAGNARTLAMQDADAVEAYLLAQPDDLPSASVLVKTTGSPETLTPTIFALSGEIDHAVVPEVESLRTGFERSIRSIKGSAIGVALLGSLALSLACLGLIGLIFYSVSQRTKEIGIRMALGATPTQLVRDVLRQFLRPVFLGLVAGVAIASALARLLRHEIYGVDPQDPTTYLAALALFLFASAVAAVIPARRALKVQPLKALRYE